MTHSDTPPNVPTGALMSDAAAWFIDGAYLFKVWQSLKRSDRLDYLKLRQYLESTFATVIDDAYYFNSDPDVASAKQNAFHSALAHRPPDGPGIRVKLYWLQKRPLFWPTSWGGGPVNHPETGRHFELIQQKAVDVGLAFHLMRSHGHRRWRTLFLAAGDSDFHEVVQHLVENEGVQLILIGSEQTISGELSPYARALIKVREIADEIARS
ncbi:MAG TPA: NYN domain-containing protein [Polyangiaceae bacterium]|nr:NYN domain-containing protein [Polyangiaceae bacterium]